MMEQINGQNNQAYGYIKLFRSIRKHWLWNYSRKKTKLEAWIDLLLKACPVENKEPVGHDLIMIKRGELLTSQEKLAKEWGWDRSIVRLFLDQLKADQMILINPTNKYTIITVCSYAGYHDWQPTKQQKNNIKHRNKPTPAQHIEEYNKNNKNINIPFDTFWNLYDKKVGLKCQIEKEWVKLNNDQRQEAIDKIPRYVQSTPDKVYRKNPLTYLRNHSWQDEIINRHLAQNISNSGFTANENDQW